MNLFNLTGKLTIDTAEYEKGVDKAKEKNNELTDNTKNTSSKAKIAWLAVATAIVSIISKVKDLIVQTAQYADQIGDLAQKWGFTTRQIQEFDYWATMNGTTLESLLTGMRGLVNQAEAGAGAFNKLGVSVKNADGTFKNQKQLFLETITALQQIENQTERNALQFEIFGRAGIELGQIINLSSAELNKMSEEAEQLGIILSEETIEKAGEFNDTLDRIKLSFQSSMAEFFAGNEEALDDFFERLTNQMEQWMPQFAKILTKVIEMLIKAIVNNLPEILDVLIESINNMPWFEILFKIVWSILKGLVKAIAGTIEGIFTGKWFGNLFGGESDVSTSSGKNFSDIMGATDTINKASTTTNLSNDNSTYNVNVNVEGTGYAEEDARKLANEVIKEIATKKQASGR